MHRFFLSFLAVLGFSGLTSAVAQKFDWGSDELKSIWEHRAEWAVSEVGDLDIDVEKLIGLRTVYDRQTNLQGEAHSLKAVFQYDSAYWNGKAAILTIWTGSGDNIVDGTGDDTAQAISSISDLETFRLRQYAGTFSGSLSYSRLDDAQSVGASVSKEGEATSKTVDGALYGYDMLNVGQIVGLYDAKHGLEKGQKFRLPYFDSRGGEITHQEYYVRDEITITDANGDKHKVWDIFSLWRNDGFGGHYYVSGEAPYFWGYKLDNVVSGELRAEVKYVSHMRMN